MDSRRLRAARGGTPQFVKPLLNSLNEMRAERLRPDQMTRKAEELLWETWGAKPGAAESAFSHGSLDLMAEHTHYFDGIGLLMPLPEGCAVAMRANSEASHRVTTNSEALGLPEAIEKALSLLFVDTDQFVDVAAVTNVPNVLATDLRAPAMVAAARSASALQARSTTESEDLALLDDPKGPDRHYLAAGIMASRSTDLSAFVLVDTRTREFLALDVPIKERPGLAVVAPSTGHAPVFVRGENRKTLRRITAALKAGPFPQLETVRDIEHRHLELAAGAVDKQDRPFLTYLITENGRAQRMVGAIQRRDWQMLGALLLISHGSRTAGLALEDAEADLIVTEVENMSLEGMYGATRLNATSRSVLMAGQLFSIPPALDRLRVSFEKRFEDPLTTLLL
jgi:galactokinase